MIDVRRLTLCFVVLASVTSCGAQSSSQVERVTTLEAVSDESNENGELLLAKVATLDQPVDAASRIGDEAIYFVARRGTVHKFIDAKLDSEPVLDIADLTEGEGERGLLGLAFSNDGATAYINFTNRDGDTTIASLGVNRDGVFARESLKTIIVIDQPFQNHNAGDIVVEPSGMIIVPMGDGGSADDPLRVSLDDSSPLGKVLRIDPRDGSFTILARGLRNPWRVDLYQDRLWLADVGQGKFEEVSALNDLTKITSSPQIADFGWSAYEANDRFNKDQKSIGHTPPVISYQHGDDGCSISGGAVAVSGSLIYRYIFADFCSGRVWSIATNEFSPKMTLHFDGLDSPTAVVRANEKLFVLSLNGTIWQIRN
ncbi:HIPL1 protein [Acidimicrobiaceae bacterium]|nr:HIPL1 protein [Acidimicrobiaceae bacterium]